MTSVTVQAVFLYEDFQEQATSTLTASTMLGEIEPISVNGLVNETKSKIGRNKIGRLEIYAHGTDTYIKAGVDDLHTYKPEKHMPKLSRLRKDFGTDGYVVLYVCQAGKCVSVISEMAKTLGVDVYATEGDIRPLLRRSVFGVSGPVVVAHPDGSIGYGSDVPFVFIAPL
jgi:Domain of unknown function (DUF4347)